MKVRCKRCGEPFPVHPREEMCGEAARIDEGKRRAPEADLFAGAASAGGDDEVVTSAAPSAAVALVGQRNESSVLFSLDALGPKSAPAPTTTESSALIDIRALCRAANADEPTSAPTDDIMNLSGGGAFASPLLAPPIVFEEEAAPTVRSRSRTPLLLGALGLGLAATTALVAIAHVPSPTPAVQPSALETTTPPVAEPPTSVVIAVPVAPSESTVAPTTPSTRIARAAPVVPAKTSATTTTTTTATTTAAPPKCCPGETETTCQMRISVGASCGETRTTTATTTAATFDRPAAARALGISVASCKRADGPTGAGHAKVTFLASGSVSAVDVEAPFGGTSVGACIAQRYRSATVPAFAGAPLTVGKTFSVE